MAAVVVPPDPRSPEMFVAEGAAIGSALDGWLVGGIHHVGSTSIPGMPAKPIIDMIAGVRVLADAEVAEPALRGLGYVRAVHRTDAVLFNKGPAARHTHHLHLTVPGSDLWRERLAFRDVLRHDPALLAAYIELKTQLLIRSGGRPYSATGKRDFVRGVLASVGIDLADGWLVDTREVAQQAPRRRGQAPARLDGNLGRYLG
jgi:GrpB-like predicted nucleotidyltransferase (UPF0157 family)